MRDLTVSDIICAFSGTINRQRDDYTEKSASEWLESGKATLIKRDGSRNIIDETQLHRLLDSYPDDMQALQLYRFPLFQFDKYIYIYKIGWSHEVKKEEFHRKDAESSYSEDILYC